ncbi:alpha-n-arabinofuranosidase a [Colletotrichum karsti]|uniref:non-reducing end alpha-L-arabinofuranosidase n=1 Tax=Colletotrichum karsti TaxID=1095194 RepID=A0A9P6LP85_9PEZI|nr:alpha-n-arabinofuranosidase a [Colletotrichum karsti]KAF9880111.1 alpha-n-arabinofuranosidase a [Colletotrichum karsti]
MTVRDASPPRPLSNAEPEEIYSETVRLEEETFSWYDPDKWYPVRIGEVFESRYQVLLKLGFGSASTSWLCRDLREHSYATLKVYATGNSQASVEKNVLRHLGDITSDHPGARLIRVAKNTFELPGKKENHICLVLETLGISLADIREMAGGKVPANLLKGLIYGVLLGIDYLHSVARVIHTDIQDGNIMLSVKDRSVLDRLVEDELELPSARKILRDRIIYASTGLEIPDQPGEPVIADFGDARIDEGAFDFEEEAMPDLYRAPEIVLGVPWNEKIDIWALGLLVWDLFEGLMEYFHWCEDMSMEPILDVWAGLGLAGLPPLMGAELEPFVEDAIREIEFVIGDINTSGGALRASLGHPEPYPLKFVEIGNEDNLAGGCESYKQRFVQFFDAIKEAYPHLTILTSTSDRNCLPDPIPEGAWLDFHDYNVPENYINAFDFYDDWDRAHPVFIGKYARWGVKWSDMRGACSEAVYMMGWERNADLIKLAAYAPTLQNYDPVNGQWTPNLIPFTNKPNGIVYTPSYHVKKMFANNHGDVVVPVTADAEVNPVWWAASKKTDGQFIVKLANYASNSTEARIQIPGKAGLEASFTSITAGPDDANSVETPDVIAAPAVINVSGDADGIFTVELGQFGGYNFNAANMQMTTFTAALAGIFFAASASATCTTSWPGFTCRSTQLGCCLDISYGVAEQNGKDENWRYDWSRSNCNTCKP